MPASSSDIWKKFAVRFALVLAVVVGVWLACSSLWLEPKYKGKAVSKWVRECVEVPGSPAGFVELHSNTINDIGSNAVPHLIQVIERGPGFFGWEIYQKAYTNLPVIVSKRLPMPIDPGVARIRAYWALAGLGDDAKNAIPFLMRQFNTNNGQLGFAAHTLAMLGDCSTSTIPQLTVFLNGADPVLSRYAAQIIARIEPKHPLLLPTTMKWVSSTNEVDRRFACLVLDYMGPEAMPAREALTRLFQDEDFSVRHNATNAIKQIDLAPDRQLWGWGKSRRRGE